MKNPFATAIFLWLFSSYVYRLTRRSICYSLIFGLGATMVAIAQDSTITQCTYDSVELVLPAGEVLEWRDMNSGAVLQTTDRTGNVINDHSPAVSPNTSTMYQVLYYNFETDNIIVDGDFEQPGGYTDTEKDALTDYSITGLCPMVHGTGPGNWGLGSSTDCIESDAANWYAEINDHTFDDGTGNMLFFDGSAASVDVYHTTVDVTLGTEYAFAAWVANIHIDSENPYEMEFYINGLPTGDVLVGRRNNLWYQYFTIWTANTTGTILISIRNLNGVGFGNDLALDDIAMAEVHTRNFIINVNQPPEVAVDHAYGIVGNVIPINNAVTTGDAPIIQYQWEFATGLLDTTDVLNPFVPDTISPGIYPISYRVSDTNSCSDTAHATVTVVDLNNPPFATVDYIEVDVNGSYSGNLLLNDTDPDGDDLILTDAPVYPHENGHIEFNADGSYTYTRIHPFSGTDSLVYRVCDIHGDCSVGSLFISLINQSPVVLGEDENTTVNALVSGNLLLNDTDPDGDQLMVTVTPAIAPGNGQIEIAGDGTYTYTPDLNFIGIDSLVYEVCDVHGACAKGSLIITVTNQPPEILDEEVTTMGNEAITGNLLLNDTDPDGDDLFLITTPVSGPVNGTITLNSDGTFTYTPNADWTGTDTILYEACDRFNDCQQARMIIHVENEAPVAVNDEFKIMALETIEGSLILNDYDPNGDSIFISEIPESFPQNGSIILYSDGTFEYTSQINMNVSDTFRYKLCDVYNDCSVGKVVITTGIEMEVPNVFTPNGDNINDVFMPGYNLTIFDRNGAILYDGTDGWDGTYKGIPVDEDTYFYSILYSVWEELDSHVKGYVVVVR